MATAASFEPEAIPVQHTSCYNTMAPYPYAHPHPNPHTYVARTTATSAIPARDAGALLGIGGANIQKLQQESGALIELESDDSRTAEWRKLTLRGSPVQVEAARCAIAALLRVSRAAHAEKQRDRQRQRKLNRQRQRSVALE